MSARAARSKNGEATMNGVDLIVTIAARSRREEFISLYQDCGVTMIISALGHGTATGEILD